MKSHADPNPDDDDIDDLLEEIDRHEVTLQPFTQAPSNSKIDSLPILGDTPLQLEDFISATEEFPETEAFLQESRETQIQEMQETDQAKEEEFKNPYVSSDYPSIPFPFADPSQMRLAENINALRPRDSISLAEVWKIDRYSKVPLCIGMVTRVIESKSARQVSMSDGLGEIEACLHGRISPKPHRGMILIMQQVSLFAPTELWRCLIVCPRNVSAIYLNQHEIN